MSYTTIYHSARQELRLSNDEYCVADCINALSSDKSREPGWCTMGRKEMADKVGVSKRTLQMILLKLIADDLIEKSDLVGMPLRTTSLWKDTIDTFKKLEYQGHAESAPHADYAWGAEITPLPVQILHGTHAESAPLAHAESAPYNNITYNKINNAAAAFAGAGEREDEKKMEYIEPEILNPDAENKKKEHPPTPLFPFQKKGNGKLYNDLVAIYNRSPTRYLDVSYISFLNNWVGIVTDHKDRNYINQELWVTQFKWNTEDRLKKWDDVERLKQDERKSNPKNNQSATGSPRPGGLGKAVARVVDLKPGSLDLTGEDEV